MTQDPPTSFLVPQRCRAVVLNYLFSHWNHLELLRKRDPWASSQTCGITCPGELTRLVNWVTWSVLQHQSGERQEDSGCKALGSRLKPWEAWRPPGAVHTKVPLLWSLLGTSLLFKEVNFIKQIPYPILSAPSAKKNPNLLNSVVCCSMTKYILISCTKLGRVSHS